MQQEIENAAAELQDWLRDPHELGRTPFQMKYVKTVTDADEMPCYIFKYKKTLFGKWRIGISSESGSFSEMNEYCEETDEQDALDMLHMLKEYWKNAAKSYSDPE